VRVEAHAPGKLILFGEYAVLEGAPAVAAAVDRRARVTLQPGEPGRWTIDTGAPGERPLAIPSSGEDPWIVRAIHQTLARLGSSVVDAPGFDVRVDSKALYEAGGAAKLGLGSSAAVVVALGAALRRALRASQHVAGASAPDDAFAHDLHVHHALQGAGSGIDVAVSFHGGVIAFRRGSEEPADVRVDPLALPSDLHVACVWTGASTSTASFLGRVRACRAERPDAYGACVDRLADLAGQARRAFEAGRGGPLVPLADEYCRAMAALGRTCGIPVVSEAHEALARLARGRGAAYKPSGAGGGDVGLLFAGSQGVLQAAVEVAQDAGYRVVDLSIGETGVTVDAS
jgi:phosphomevalonate kinase